MSKLLAISISILLISVIACVQQSLPISVGMVYTGSGRHGVFYRIGLPANSLAVFFDQIPMMSFWGEVRIRNGTEVTVLAPVYEEDVRCIDLGTPSLLTSRFIESYGGRVVGDMSFVEWRSKILKLLNSTVVISWVGHGVLISSNNDTVLLMLQARMNVSRSTSAKGLERFVELAPLTTIFDLDKVDVYAFGILSPALGGRMLVEKELLNYAKNRSVVASVLVVYVRKFNLTMIFSGALIGRSSISKNVLKVYLGLVRSTTLNNTLSSSSQLFIVITRLGIDRVLEMLKKASRSNLNPLQIVSMIWRCIAYGVERVSEPRHSIQIQTQTVISVTTVRVVDPVMTSVLTIVSVCIGVVLGFVLGRRSR